MHEVVAALSQQQDELAGLLAGRDDDAWRAPTRCAGWDVADVVLHLAQTNEMAVGSATGRYADVTLSLTRGLPPARDVDEGVAAMVARQRGASLDDIHRRWLDSAAELRDALADCDPHARVQWVAGELSARTLATTRLAETWIHTGDVADAWGETLPATPRLWHIARLAWRTLPYAFARAGQTLHGPVTLELDGPGDRPWLFASADAVTTIRGDGVELCLVAGRRSAPGDTSLRGEGPDADAVLELIRTYA